MKVIKTKGFQKQAEAKGDDQFPSVNPGYDTIGQEGNLFTNPRNPEEVIEEQWEKKKRKRRRKGIKVREE